MDNTDRPPKAFKPLTALGQLIERLEELILSVGSLALAIMLIANVIARTFFKSIYFVEEVSEFLVLLITFVGVSYAARKARHIRMGAIFDALPVKVQQVLIYIISGVNAVVMFVMAYLSYRYMMDAKNLLHVTSALRLPYWTFYIILPVGFFAAGIHYIRTIIKNIVEKEVWASPEQKSEYEEEHIVVDGVYLQDSDLKASAE